MLGNIKYWRLFFYVFFGLFIIIVTLMILGYPKDELDSTAWVSNSADNILTFINDLGFVFTRIKEGHILNYFVVMTLCAFAVSYVVFRIKHSSKTTNE